MREALAARTSTMRPRAARAGAAGAVVVVRDLGKVFGDRRQSGRR